MKVRPKLYVIMACVPICFMSCMQEPLVDESKTEEWQYLFNGVDLTGWTIKIADQPIAGNFRNTFLVEDSMIRIKYDEYENFDDAYGHMYYEKPYSYYRLQFEYRFVGEQTPGGASWNVRNSGVMIHSQSAQSNEYGQHFPVSIEFQTLGGLSNGEPRTTGNVCTPGTAVVMGDTINYRHCISSSSKTYDGDQWVASEIIVHGGEAMYFLVEGDTVLIFQKPQIGGGFTNTQDDRARWASFGIEADYEKMD